MNPFTRFLSQWSQDHIIAQFIPPWDTVEALVIRVYKSGRATAEDEESYRRVRASLQKIYPQLAEGLRPYWQQTKVGGKLEHGDPFLFLLTADRAADFVDNWVALQHLPAAREALNQYILSVSEER